MRIGADPGPGQTASSSQTHIVYDNRTGRILATHHVIGAAHKSPDPAIDLRQSAHQTSGVPVEHLGILTDPKIPDGEGEVKVDLAAKRLQRSAAATHLHIRP